MLAWLVSMMNLGAKAQCETCQSTYRSKQDQKEKKDQRSFFVLFH